MITLLKIAHYLIVRTGRMAVKKQDLKTMYETLHIGVKIKLLIKRLEEK